MRAVGVIVAHLRTCYCYCLLQGGIEGRRVVLCCVRNKEGGGEDVYFGHIYVCVSELDLY